MKKLFLIPMFVLGGMAFLNAQNPVMTNTQGAPSTAAVQNPNGPVMTFEVTEFNFGSIKQGDVVTHEFHFKNTGKEPLIINNAVGSCGCTVPDWPKEPIKPGGEAVIKVTFNSAGKLNQQDKTVTITYDTDKQVVLHLKGNVEAPAPAGSATPAQSPAPAQPAPAPKQAAKPAAQPKQQAAPATVKSDTPKH